MMLFNLSLKNVKKSFKDYTIYFLTLIFGVAIFYIFNSVDSQMAMAELSDSKYTMVKNLIQVIEYLSIFVSIVLGFLIIYANNFLLKRRKKELGLYMTLGMGKAQISKLLFFETIAIGILSLVIGLAIGIFLSQMISVWVINLFEAEVSMFQFVFSKAALFKTCIYFVIIYLCVMIFNMITVSKSKLIKLLNSHKTNEKVAVKNKWIASLLFVLAIGCIGISYYYVTHDALNFMDITFLIMVVCGALGTLFLFSSVAAFMMELVKLNKRSYFKNLNMFVLKQISSKMNTTTISMTMISIMLLLTIGILSTAISMSQAMNKDLLINNLTDYTIRTYNYYNAKQKLPSLESALEKYDFDYKSESKNYSSYTNYYYPTDDVTLGNYITMEEIKANIKIDPPSASYLNKQLVFMKQSEYNALMEISGKKELKVNLKQNEYAVVCMNEITKKIYNSALENGKILKLPQADLKPGQNQIIEVALENSDGGYPDEKFIVPDEYVTNMELLSQVICGNYTEKDEKKLETLEQEWDEELKKVRSSMSEKDEPSVYPSYYTRIFSKNAVIGTRGMLTFIGLYLGIIFGITSAAVLALGQLSESSDNKARYSILKKIGADEKMINKSLFIQIGIIFLFPLIVALVHAVVALTEINKIVSTLGNIDIASNIALVTLFILIIYGGYFVATYLCSKNIINEREK